MRDRRRVLEALLREDLGSFLHQSFKTLGPSTRYRENWHIRTFCHHLERVARGECRRLIINVPPRSMKSICASVAFPAWVLGREPSKKIMCVSYSKDLTRKHALDFRTVIENPWYRQIFPGMEGTQRRQRDTEIVTSEHGYRFASSLGGSILGRGADLIIIDDPIKPQDALSEKMRQRVNDLYDNSIYTRLNEKTLGSIIIVMQRLHEDDLVGHVLQREGWEIVAIPAIETEDRDYRIGPAPHDLYHRVAGEVLHPDREPEAILETLRRTLGSLSFSAQYQQQPLPLEGNFLKRRWLRSYVERPEAFDLVMNSWDTASTEDENSDYSVGTVWGLLHDDIYLLDVIRDRLEVPDLRRLIERTQRESGAAATLIEDTELGRAITQEMRQARNPARPILWRPQYDKKARFMAQTPKFEAGQVLLPREAPWLASYIQELLAFPNARHDDQVDSTSQALAWLTSHRAAGHPPERPNPTRPQGSPRHGRRGRLVDYSREP
jgi:predicted phage terminase large subunit-like protein